MRTVSQFKSLHVRKDRALLPDGGMLGVDGLRVLQRTVDHLFLAIHIERAREAMHAFEEAKVPSAMSYAEIR